MKIPSLTFKDKYALTDDKIKEYWKKLMPSYYSCTIINMNEISPNLPLFTVVFTGEKTDYINLGNKQHWVGIYNNFLFDSYGLKNHPYNLPSYLNKEKNPQLQEWGSAVCGEYVLLFFNHVADQLNIAENKLVHADLISTFMERYSLGINNTRENDRKILKAFEKKINNG